MILDGLPIAHFFALFRSRHTGDRVVDQNWRRPFTDPASSFHKYWPPPPCLHAHVEAFKSGDARLLISSVAITPATE